LLTLLVPQGAEYQAVCRGLKRVSDPPEVIPLAIGIQPVTQILRKWQQSSSFAKSTEVLVMGLCGSLTAELKIGERVLYRGCRDGSGREWQCDPRLVAQLQKAFQPTLPLVKGLTSDRLIASAAEKQQLGQTHQADVVDMEGSAIMTTLAQTGRAIAMLRVISDDIHHDLPDLTPAIRPDGTLRSFPLALEMIKQPIAATRLIRGSLQGLQALQTVTTSLFQEGFELEE
jgi:nucleoside phosphorylase